MVGQDGEEFPNSSSWLFKKVWFISILGTFGALFSLAGIMLLLKSHDLVECTAEYQDAPLECGPVCYQLLVIKPEHCEGSLKTETRYELAATSNGTLEVVASERKIIKAPVYMYYQLDNFNQAVPNFVGSRSADQLAGKTVGDHQQLISCEPALYSPNSYLILAPCGLAARSVFNDTFVPIKACTFIPAPCFEPLPMRQGVEDIVWPNDPKYLFKNPSGPGTELYDQWLPEDIFPGRMENAHFHVWMKPAAFPNFRKLYGILDEDVALPLMIHLVNRYPINSINGTKKIVLSQSWYLGEKSMFIGALYVYVGILLMASGVVSAGFRTLRKTPLRTHLSKTIN